MAANLGDNVKEISVLYYYLSPSILIQFCYGCRLRINLMYLIDPQLAPQRWIPDESSSYGTFPIFRVPGLQPLNPQNYPGTLNCSEVTHSLRGPY